MGKKNRRRYGSEEKAAILRRHLKDKVLSCSGRSRSISMTVPAPTGARPPRGTRSLSRGLCSGGNYYAAPMTSAFANLFPSAGCIDPATSQPPTPHPFGAPVNIPGSAASIDFYPLVETGP
jgi:hypothetical protein